MVVNPGYLIKSTWQAPPAVPHCQALYLSIEQLLCYRCIRARQCCDYLSPLIRSLLADSRVDLLWEPSIRKPLHEVSGSRQLLSLPLLLRTSTILLLITALFLYITIENRIISIVLKLSIILIWIISYADLLIYNLI